MPDLETLRQRYEQAGQDHVFRYWDELGERARRRLLRQLEELELSTLCSLRDAVGMLRATHSRDLAPAPVFQLVEREFPYQLSDAARAVAPLGQSALGRGEVAVLLVAGGQATRLGIDMPKGCFPLLPLSDMTLFEVFARKLTRIGREYGRTPPLYVMVGRHNRHATESFWEEHEFFGLNPDDVSFFAQGELPALDDAGQLVMSAKDALWTGPDGHGGVLKALHDSNLLADMRRRGVRLISYLQVDNVQAPVADAAFLGLHLAEGAEVSLKVVRKTDPSEQVGIYCLDSGVPGIVEYSEFSEGQSNERDSNGDLMYWAGNTALHAFSVDFLARLGETGAALPLHAAYKRVPQINAQGEAITTAEPNAWKFERFIFDTIPLAGKVVALEVPRDEQFLPLKNATGPFSPDGVRQSYQQYFGKAVQMTLGAMPPAIEVDPLLAENARELIELIKNSQEAKDWNLNAPLRIR
jgi:UDP-N-acetylglucosamine/UDP-N-acetylgalactosamine diphosphorylase